MFGIKGFGSELSLLLLMILIFDKIIIPLYINWKKDRRLTLRTQKLQVNPVGNRQGTVKPGHSETCIKHGKKLTELATEINNIKDDITEIKKNNREDHDKIFDKIDKLRNKRR